MSYFVCNIKGGTVHSAQAFRSQVELVIDLCPVTNIDLVKRLVFSPSRPSFMFYPVSGRGRIRTCVTITRLYSASQPYGQPWDSLVSCDCS